MPSNRVELAEYICEVAEELIPLAKQAGLSSVAHCLELAVICAAEEVEAPADQAPTKPSLTVIAGRGDAGQALRTDDPLISPP